MSVTSAPAPLGADQSRRARRYLVQMGIRVVCFLLAVALWRHVPVWVGVTLLAGAVVLPSVAVLGANAGRERSGAGGAMLDSPALGAGPPAGPPPAPPGGSAPAQPTAPPDARRPYDPPRPQGDR